jgi:hypothetical protein
MQEGDFPALYRSADELSLKAQTHFFGALKLHLVLLIVAAILSVVTIPHWSIAVLQVLALLGALSCSIYLFAPIAVGMRPERSPNRLKPLLGASSGHRSTSTCMNDI